MKQKLYKLFLIFAALLLSVSAVFAQTPDKDKKDDADIEVEPETVKTIAAAPGIVVTMCLESGNIVVIGGDKREVRVTAEDPARVSLRAADGTNASGLATRLEVVVADAPKAGHQEFGECRGSSDMDLEVPRGATVYVKTRDGDIEISNVAEARAESSTGNINILRVAKAVEATTMSGDIALEDSSGRIRLRSISGGLEAIRTKLVEQNDFLYANTVSGDVKLEQIAQPRVEAGTISGEVLLTGSLAQGGFYDFKTITGDITLNMPDGVSFQVTAKVSQGGEVITDFPLKYTGGISTFDAMSSGKLAGSYGTGPSPATVNLVSFSGTLRLRKK
jgi:hypothetical protein